MKTIIQAISNLDKQTAKDLKLVAEQSFEWIRNLEDTDERKEKVCEIIEMVIEATKKRIKEITIKELENN